MKKTAIFSLVALAALITGCNDDESLRREGEGRLSLRPEIKSDFKTVSRAVVDDEAINESLVIWISNSKGPVRKYKGLSNIPAEEWLVADSYVAEAWAGDSVSASFDKRWFRGSAEFTITAGSENRVEIPCKIANVLVELKYEEGLSLYLDEMTFTIGHKRGQLVYEDGKEGISYFMMPSNDKDLEYTFTAKNKGNGKPIEYKGSIDNAQPTTKYILSVKGSTEDTPLGGTYFEIMVNTEVEKVPDHEVIIELPPVIDGYYFNANENLVLSQGDVGRKSMFITASAEITEATLSIVRTTPTKQKENYLAKILERSDNENAIDFRTNNTVILDQVDAKGINAIYNYNAETKEASLKINFEETFTNSMPEGVYEFNYVVRDSKDRSSELTSVVQISNDPVELNKVNDYDVWTNRAILTGNILREINYGNPVFHYRKVGEASWRDAPAPTDMRVEITGLTPATEYEYCLTTDVDNFESPTFKFTTEAILQLENAGFEEWNTSGKAFLLCADKSSMYWDSGNHGSSTMSKNVTQNDSEIKHSGQYSVKMMSQFVGIGTIGKFAAGNAFVGEYLKTDGTDGVLGWGRPFASRPKALKGYVKYTPAAVTHASSGVGLNKGDMDEGIIYIAILDETTIDFEGKKYPVIIKTKESERQVFNKNAANVIAYGEEIFKGATAGDGMIEFEIPLDYIKTDVKAANIMVTMSASRYGDYFTGGPSTMWVDDLELVY